MSDSRTIAAKPGLEITYGEIRTELFRKSIHMMVALVPAAASINLLVTLLMLGTAIIAYSVCETYRVNGRTVAVVSGITAMAARKRDEGGFVFGPVTLAVGSMLALMLYPSAAAAVAIYALAFGDSAASIIGRFFGRLNMPAFGSKTLEGTLACAVAVFLSTFAVTSNPSAAVSVAVAASMIELIPVKDLDNLLIPVGTGMVALLFI
ncbi:MAG: phosphatidate cytidylyltransferase [Spirochaetales bacterium]|uniref:Phosphatidate cytidylyltransferase n=1 Tax=Candidatus Thalassospirochaeta sargassi TaxID=3119039 RepID=A0AAJ1IBG5_9SPIO|nr:phosphatidate cytidylyltransferase [Spirochaetales bacterium]